MKIQGLLEENKIANPARKGMYTSGFIAEGEHQMVLYFSDHAHAGENFETIIAHRADDQDPVMRMADALASNSKHGAPALETKCNSYAFRRFKSLLSTYPEQGNDGRRTVAFTPHVFTSWQENPITLGICIRKVIKSG